MKHITLFALFSFLLLILAVFPQIARAQSVSPTASTSATISQKPEEGISPANDTLQSFFSGFDWISSGLTFHTPDVFQKEIVLSDGTVLAGISGFRTLFLEIATPLFAIVIGVVAISQLSSENPARLRFLIKRLVLITALFLLIPQLLSLTITATNLLNDTIARQAVFNLSNFINAFLQNGGVERIASFQGNPLLTAFFSPRIILQTLLLIITFGFLLLGFLYVILQSVIRFVSLLFLSVLFPLVLPFALSEKTEHIPLSYLRIWLSFLIQQPAFVLGFALVSTILTSLLQTHQGNIGMLFLYAGSLFFLGSVNILVSKLFTDSWAAVATNLSAGVGSGALLGASYGSFDQFKRGAFSGSASNFRSFAGKQFGQFVGLTPRFTTVKQPHPQLPPSSQPKTGIVDPPKTLSSLPPFSKELQRAGLSSVVVDKEKGIVSLSGTGYQTIDTKHRLRTIYPTVEEGIADGVDRSKLNPVSLDGQRVVDLSAFLKSKNPYNEEATTLAKKQGLASNYAHLTPTSSPDRVSQFLSLSKERMQQENLSGVIVKRYGNNGNTKSANRYVRINVPLEKV